MSRKRATGKRLGQILIRDFRMNKWKDVGVKTISNFAPISIVP